MKLLLFQDPAFPGYRFSSTIAATRTVDAAALPAALAEDWDVLINMHGEYFPDAAAPALVNYLTRGGGLVNLFAPPLTRLVAADGRIGRKRLTWLRKLLIHCTYDVALADTDVVRYQANPARPGVEALLPFLPVMDCVSLLPMPTTTKYVVHEWGSPGAMDVRVTPLVQGLNERGEPYASPVVLMEHAAGTYAGGRWIFVNQDVHSGCEAALEALASLAAKGERRIMLQPLVASYDEGEKVRLRLQAQSSRYETEWTMHLRVMSGQQCLHEESMQIYGGHELSQRYVDLPGAYPPGHYMLLADCVSKDGERQQVRQGFCVRDDAMLCKLPRLRADGELFRFGTHRKPIMGSTYMSSSVGRAFLHMPNPGEWLEDMRDMRAQGIEWIRTGLWCHAREYMLDDGCVEERLLRSLDAFLQCAATAGLYVTFTFFTFCPVNWEGTHPYLDRRAVEAQKRFIRTLVSRHSATTNVDWDLINEPYWHDHPQGRLPEDHTEQAAFTRWLEAHYRDAFDLNDALDTAWPEASAVPLPRRENINFDVLDIDTCKNGLIWQDYKRFSQEAFRAWVREMRDCIRQLSSEAAVAFGQDEGLRGQRPSPINYRLDVDYTTIHNWSDNDHIAWNIVFSRAWGLPHVAQEVGLFYTENPDGFPRYTERESMLLMQRKFAYAFGLGCAGVLQWLWNTNIYLRSANEAHIGIVRADGSRKPEGLLFRRFAAFFARAEDCFQDQMETPPIAVVFPFTNDFSNRNFAQRGTVMAAEVLLEELHQPFVPVSEYDLEVLAEARPRLVIVPSPHHMDRQAAQRLVALTQKLSAVLLWTGPMGLDEHFQPVDVQGRLRPLRRFERLGIQSPYCLRFEGGLASTAFVEEPSGIQKFAIGGGMLLHTGIPVELGAEREPVVALYEMACRKAGIACRLAIDGGDGVFIHAVSRQQSVMYTAVNESGGLRKVTIRDLFRQRRFSVTLQPGESEMWIDENERGMVSSLNELVEAYDDMERVP